MHLTANPILARGWLNTPAASVKKHVSGREMSVQWLVETAIDGFIKTA